MTDYRRADLDGGCYFFTVVTYDCDFSLRWARIKAGFTRRYLAAGGTECGQSPSRTGKRERGIWQRRFWEHQIRNEMDLRRHMDYIHYNPVTHGLVENVEDWPWSSYHRFAKTCTYPDQYWQTARNGFDDLAVYE